MIKEDKLSFGYYFDCHNKIILATFTDVYRAILGYLQKQQRLVWNELEYIHHLIKDSVQFLDTKNKTKYIEKRVFGATVSEESEVLFKTELEMASGKEKQYIEDIYG